MAIDAIAKCMIDFQEELFLQVLVILISLILINEKRHEILEHFFNLKTIKTPSKALLTELYFFCFSKIIIIIIYLTCNALYIQAKFQSATI